MTRVGKTGGEGRPWIELEKPRPPRVDDRYEYWQEAPATLSPRCEYWLRQIRRGWLPNRRISAECYDCSAGWYGVYIWEYLHALAPLIAERRQLAEGGSAA
ncbi:hypothetical protein ACQP1O_42995 (plasmid) [Nocardia sp. CA-151230]|uniref:hypothetical protein n=1 Tax=Nocardia sp. CA-151230 TaxID=3239982 RepID=UPI003D94A178